MDIAALVVSVIALFVGGFALWQNKRQADAGVQVAAIESARAEAESVAAKAARPVLSVTRSRMDGAIVITNAGQAVARDLDLVIETVLGDVGGPPYMGVSPFPCDLHPGTSMRIGFTCAGGTVDRVQVSLRWTDELGSHEELSRLSLI